MTLWFLFLKPISECLGRQHSVLQPCSNWLASQRFSDLMVPSLQWIAWWSYCSIVPKGSWPWHAVVWQPTSGHGSWSGLPSSASLQYFYRDTLPQGELFEVFSKHGMSLDPDFVFLAQVNLKYGVKHEMSRTGKERDTCTACAGSMILEFSTLSRLSGESIFEVTHSLQWKLHGFGFLMFRLIDYF